MKTKTNYFRYNTNNGCREGFFNIYQSGSGAIYLMMGNVCTALTYKQVNELFLDVYSLDEFDHELFLKFYKIQS